MHRVAAVATSVGVLNVPALTMYASTHFSNTVKFNFAVAGY